MSLKRSFAVVVIALLFAPPVLATVVINPGSIIANTLLPAGVDPGTSTDQRIVDQSGLSEKYSEIAPFDPYQGYITGPPVPAHPFFTDTEAFRSESGKVAGHIDFSLGGTFSLTNFALWNGPAMFGIREFDILISLDKSFSSPVTVWSFEVLNSGITDVQSFEFEPTPGAFVRLGVRSNFGGNNDILGEVAFGGTMTVVPEPATLALLGLGLAGFGFRRRRLR